MYACFVDLQKAFDTIPRPQLFHKLLTEYSIGGKFLKILQAMYTENKIYVKVSEGLLEPFISTISVKQGCVFSPIIFNLYIDKICTIFDQSCSPVTINTLKLNCLLWADDLLLLSETDTGLQSCINKMQEFYTEVGLKINLKKTKVIIFNKRGVSLKDKFRFYLRGEELAITDQYQYLGIKLRPSGSLQLATEELSDKAMRSWFGISNIIFKNKRMDPNKAFGIFDSLVTPIALYGCEFWAPYLISASGFDSIDRLLDTWESFKAEKINQKCSRIILSVHNKSSRLAVLGELGRYPLFLTALSQCVKFKLFLNEEMNKNALLKNLVTEMTEMESTGQDCWWTRVVNIEKLLNFDNSVNLRI